MFFYVLFLLISIVVTQMLSLHHQGSTKLFYSITSFFFNLKLSVKVCKFLLYEFAVFFSAPFDVILVLCYRLSVSVTETYFSERMFFCDRIFFFDINCFFLTNTFFWNRKFFSSVRETIFCDRNLFL